MQPGETHVVPGAVLTILKTGCPMRHGVDQPYHTLEVRISNWLNRSASDSILDVMEEFVLEVALNVVLISAIVELYSLILVTKVVLQESIFSATT